MVSLACVFPLDLVKTRLQNQQTSLGIQEYSSM
nr:unnamed protein product [Callosobruchus analis]